MRTQTAVATAKFVIQTINLVRKTRAHRESIRALRAEREVYETITETLKNKQPAKTTPIRVTCERLA